ncbi:MAG: NO-inducible flavohemoprotein [Fuerstiella sp.]
MSGNNPAQSQPAVPQLSESTIQIIQAITPAVAEHAVQITTNFYGRMFQANPEVKAFFNFANQESGRQPLALAGAVAAYFSNIDRLEVLGPAVELIAQKHCSLGVQPEHYPIVGGHLLDAIGEVMGDAVTDDVVAAVGEAYGLLAHICIERERQIYQQQKEGAGGWNGSRQFAVKQKKVESVEVTSFYLQPTDGGAIPNYLPGQYLTVRFDLSDDPTAPRNYSLSHRPGQDFYRISVKREPAKAAAPAGLISNHLHDQVNEGDVIEVGPPCGEFTLDAASQDAAPLVFLAAGIGITPLLSMIHSTLHAKTTRKLSLIHACRSASVRAFVDEVAVLQSENPNLACHFLYEDSDSGDATGHLTKDQLAEWSDVENAEFYCCGPPAFLDHVTSLMNELSVDASRQHMEFFGPKPS